MCLDNSGSGTCLPQLGEADSVEFRVRALGGGEALRHRAEVRGVVRVRPPAAQPELLGGARRRQRPDNGRMGCRVLASSVPVRLHFLAWPGARSGCAGRRAPCVGSGGIQRPSSRPLFLSYSADGAIFSFTCMALLSSTAVIPCLLWGCLSLESRAKSGIHNAKAAKTVLLPLHGTSRNFRES